MHLIEVCLLNEKAGMLGKLQHVRKERFWFAFEKYFFQASGCTSVIINTFVRCTIFFVTVSH